MSVSLTELRQNLFTLADQVAATGEPLIVMRHGVRLKLIRDDAPLAGGGRLARLQAQSLVLGEPLQPEESPAVWSAPDGRRVADAEVEYRPAPRTRKR